MKRLTLAALAVVAMVAAIAGTPQAEDRLFRFPDIHNDVIVFSHGGDLWTVSAQGGVARRITTHEGIEIFPRFSPDGKQIAFTGEYDGDQSVYVMPADGGTPKRLSYQPGYQRPAERHGPENVVMDWTPDGSKILYRARYETEDLWLGKLYLVSPQGGYPATVPVPVAGFSKFSPDGKKLVYCPITRDFRTWKRYKGGMAQDVWIYDLATYDAEKITDWVGTDNVPLWIGDKIYFNSDRTGTLNIYGYDPATKQTTPVTNFTEYDVRWPESGPGGKIVFENGGYLFVLDAATKQARKVEITLNDDRVWMRPEFVNVSGQINEFEIAPDGKRALFVARGEAFTVPAEHGNTRNLTNTSGAKEKSAVWSPDGKWIAYLSDKTGEDEIYLVPADGKGGEVRLTTDGHCTRYELAWSPDSKKLIFSDKNTTLYYLDIDQKKPVKIDFCTKGELRDYSWSPDSKWIVYSKTADNQFGQIVVYSLVDGTRREVTTAETNDFNPVFDPDGRYVYFISDRNYNALIGNEDWTFVNRDMNEIVAVTLAADAPSPFAPRSDEAAVKTEEPKGSEDKKKDKDKEKDAKKEAKDIKIDFAGITQRQVSFPIPAGSYGNLTPTKNKLFYLSFGFGGYSGPMGTQKTDLHAFDLEKREDNVFMSDVSGYELSADGAKLLFHKGNTFGIVDAGGKSAQPSEGVLDVSGMQMSLDRTAEYKQMFDEAWRLERDFFYDSLMHGVDWKKMYDRYAQIVPYAAHRFDLTYLIGELIGELACSHTYAGAGDRALPERSRIGLLGVDWTIDNAAGRYRIARIIPGQNWREDRRSPLSEPGIKVREGDYVLKINGQELIAGDHPYRLLDHQAGKQVTLTVNDKSTLDGAHDITVVPVEDETELRYFDWTEKSRRFVDSVSGGKIGYMHIPDMGAPGINEFVRMFYPQLNKEALIVDVRNNGGGNVSQMILERLRRELVGMRAPRNWDVGTTPGSVFIGPMVCLANQYSCSDGDNFPWFFKKYKLGPVIGKRTWGGVVGIRGYRALLDGGNVTTPEFAAFGLDRDWIMENRGVEPDIDVDNLPKRVMAGFDDQLIKAIEVLKEKLAQEPAKLPERPEPPGKR